MGIPGTGGQLLVLLLFVLPGSVFQTTRTRLRGPIPSDQDGLTKVLRALAVSTGLNAIYLTIFGEALLNPLRAHSMKTLEEAVNVRVAGLWALVLLFVVPALLACVAFWSSQWKWPSKLAVTVPWTRPAYHPASRTWDYAFTDIGPSYVRVLSADGRWAGGWFSYRSMAASFPEPLELFIEGPYRMGENGEFLEPIAHAHGMYVRCDDAHVVEIYDGSSLAAADFTTASNQSTGPSKEVAKEVDR